MGVTINSKNLIALSLSFLFDTFGSLATARETLNCSPLLSQISLQSHYEDVFHDYTNSLASEAQGPELTRDEKIKSLAAISVKSPESLIEEIALTNAVLHYLDYHSPLLIPSPEDLTTVSESAKLQTGDLTSALRAQKLFRLYESLHDERVKETRPHWQRRYLPSIEDEARRRVESSIVKKRIYPNLVRAFETLGVKSQKRRWIDKLTYSPLSTWVEYAAAVGANTVLLTGARFPIAYPLSSPSSLVKVKSHILETVERKGWDEAYPEIKSELLGWGITDAIWRLGRRAYLTSLSTIALYATLVYSPYAWTAYTAQNLDDTHMAQYEQTHYDSEKIIAAQYLAWRESLDFEPSQLQKENKLKALRQMEAQGVFRIYR